MIVSSGFTKVNLTQHQNRAVFVYQLITESIFDIIVYLSYFHDTWVGIVFVDGITGRSNAVVKPNSSCNQWEIIIKKFGNITGFGLHIVIFAEKDIMSVSEPFVWKERTYCSPKISFFAQRSLKYFCIDCFLILTTWFLARRFTSQYCFQNLLNLCLIIFRLYWAFRKADAIWFLSRRSVQFCPMVTSFTN